jgi:hypothetical protein
MHSISYSIFRATPKRKAKGCGDTAQYIFSTFPIVEREDVAAHGRSISRDLCLAYVNALVAGDPEAKIEI